MDVHACMHSMLFHNLGTSFTVFLNKGLGLQSTSISNSFQTATIANMKATDSGNEYLAEKALAHAASLKSFEGKYEDNKFTVYISRSLTPQERNTENAILKKRRELISNGCDPSHLRIKNLELYQDGKKVDIPISV